MHVINNIYRLYEYILKKKDLFNVKYLALTIQHTTIQFYLSNYKCSGFVLYMVFLLCFFILYNMYQSDIFPEECPQE